MKTRLFALLAFISLMFSACAAPRFYIDQEWMGGPKPATAKVVFSMPTIANPDDLKDDLPEYENNFVKWFGPQMKEYFNTESRNKVKYSMKQVKPADITYTKQKLGDEDFDAPAFDGIEDNAAVYVVVSDIWIGRDMEDRFVDGRQKSFGMGSQVGGFEARNVFATKCKYAFYDAKTKKLLGFGHAEGTSAYTYVVTRGDWERSLWAMVTKILWNTPLVAW